MRYSTLGESEMNDCDYQSTLLLDGTTFLYFHDVMLWQQSEVYLYLEGPAMGSSRLSSPKFYYRLTFFQLDLF